MVYKTYLAQRQLLERGHFLVFDSTLFPAKIVELAVQSVEKYHPTGPTHIFATAHFLSVKLSPNKRAVFVLLVW